LKPRVLRLGAGREPEPEGLVYIPGVYRLLLTTQLAITPDVQWILHPALNPNTGSLWVASLRARNTF